MERNLRVFLVIAAALWGLALCGPALSAPAFDRDRVRELGYPPLAAADAAARPGKGALEARSDYPQRLAQQGGRVPLSVVLSNIRSRYPGKHLDSSLNGNYYNVKWLTPDGRLLYITADASTGRIVSVSGD